jgi:hypothetical protein
VLLLLLQLSLLPLLPVLPPPPPLLLLLPQLLPIKNYGLGCALDVSCYGLGCALRGSLGEPFGFHCAFTNEMALNLCKSHIQPHSTAIQPL